MKKTFVSILMGLLVVASSFAYTISDGEKVLDKVYENAELGDVDYSCTITLISEKPGTPKEQAQFKVFERVAEEQFSMIQILPEADKGNGYLREGDNLWYYDPIGRKFSHTSLKENIGDSDAKVSDMTKDYSWRDNYEVTDVKDGKLGAYDVWIISINAISSEPAYAKSVVYVRKDVPIILKQEDLSTSDRLMRTILMPKYTKVKDVYVATQMIIRDELNPGEQTQQIISDISLADLPDRIFTKAYLEQIN